MSMTAFVKELSRSAAIRAQLSHPIIDADGHTAEFEPMLIDYLRETAGANAVTRFKSSPVGPFSYRWHQLSSQERRAERTVRPLFWVHPTKNTLDRATSSLPKLLNERLDEFGIDFTVIYPSIGLFAIHGGDDLRRPLCRAYNRMNADLYRPYSRRMTPVAVIPMNTPEEAIEELDYAVGVLGLKAIVMAAYVRRAIPEAARKTPETSRHAYWLDTIALDSEYDYDPVWRKCIELKVNPSFHSPSVGTGFRASISNFSFNHIGHFAASAEAICKSLFFGGVTRRFPELKFSFLEGGAAWACVLLNDLLSHWEKHGAAALEKFDPENIDHALVRDLFAKYGEDYGGRQQSPESDKSALLWGNTQENRLDLDEFARCEIKRADDIRELFVPQFYFGCEGDDRMTALAYDRRLNPFGAKLNALYSSDLGHFDLPDMRDAAYEAYELLDHEMITQDDFHDFVFGAASRFFTNLNRDFFKGTAVEADVAKYLRDAGATGRK
jgi:predicted TIM-barrel fold metal-dependent hydrolase